jgi:hypothetical protein
VSIDVKPHLSPTSVAGFPITANLTATSAGCSSTLTATVCDVQITLGPGAYDATLTTFDGTSGSGNRLSAAQSMPLAIVEGQANTVPLALGGIPVSVQILASGQAGAGHGFVFTLPDGALGTLSAFGVDADGNTIIGAGAPTITATTSDATQIVVTAPTSTVPNAIGVRSMATSAIAHVTVTVTPVAAAGASAITRTVTVQSPSRMLLYLAAGTRIRVFDATGSEVTKSGTGFDSVSTNTIVGAAYNPSNGIIYVAIQVTGASYVVAFDRNGVAQPLAAGASTTTGTFGAMTYDSANGLLYIANWNAALDAAGNQVPLTGGTIGFGYGLTYDPTNNVIVSTNQTFNADGSVHGSFPFASQFKGAIYSPYNGLIYEASDYPTGTTAYSTSGSSHALTGTFINNSSQFIAAFGADPLTGNIFITTNGNNTYGFDANGNALGLPWHDLIGVGSPSDVGAVLLLPAQ